MKNFTHKKRNGLALWLLTLMCLASVNVWGQETVYSYELKQKTWDGNGSKTLNGITWSLDAPGAGFWGYDGTKGQQIGSGSKPATSINLSTEDFKGTIKSVVIETSGASKINATIQVKVGNVGYGDETKITKTNTPYKFDGQSSGKVEVIWTNTSDAAIYLKKITVTYEEGAATQCIAPTFSPASGTSFANTLTVTASTATEGGKIVYTTDPEAILDANSTEFPSEGLTIDATTTIRAITVDTGALVCVSAVKKQSGIVIKSRLHHKLNISEVVYANLGLVGLVVLVYFKIYIFVPAVLMFVLFIVLSTRIQSGITEDGVLVGTTFIEWEFMRSFLLENQGEDSNVIVLKIRANRKTYILVCNREDRFAIDEIFRKNNVRSMGGNQK